VGEPFVETESNAIVVTGFRRGRSAHLTGRTPPRWRRPGTTPEETVDLLVEDDNNVGALYFAMSEDDVRKVLSLPWVSSTPMRSRRRPRDLPESIPPEGVRCAVHVLGTYVRDEGIFPSRKRSGG
jgi:hypothetical protein